MKKNTIYSILLTLAVYFLTAGLSYFVFSPGGIASQGITSPVAAPSKAADGQTIFDSNQPKTESCPINGALYSKQQRAWWEKHRPLGIMIENHQEARPQSGLSSADTIYETVAEGGITRFLAIFYCQDAGQVGPIRSARTYFLDFASEYGDHPLYTHVGGANQPGPADALSQINDYDWGGYNDMNQFAIGFPVFWRDSNRLGHPAATEHTMYSTTGKLWEYAAVTRGLKDTDKKGTAWTEGFTPYSFKEDTATSGRPTSQTVHLEFWSSDKNYFVDWTYDPVANEYKRANSGVIHIDRDTNKQLTTKNIVVLSMVESSANDGYENNAHLLYKTKGTGKATVFMDGKKITGTWKKSGRTARTIITDSSGNPVKFNYGKIWFEILPTDGVVTVK
ncbi:MAG: hypothetical protein CO135_01215 [Candidatus Levybacteria bacterium CG_4_9_14_3_um_filter_35_16]|nr:MAG: hypothetical protein COW87_03285 [Candidatus Levybacteria bacterium CG22_combo_CG10-13_8_21_14_all_35_11]PIZ98293.1 MAG: hypothetical protein COX78_03330 [Candidatus Levybacteria bacterium CG_4_10_14_0_2_um_filter_35_8]PJA91400.1 MAG: hypothetical protein CO135_01215 [Candidatus Levybacteria bacterium CG_4_9_14_3_um_filter_35_16]PJC54191.1 MAG: hypothetical protein CO028_03580 [Candidatus Levybacteria bacterium CG_4_9_14_0_2_um_filter_35_21]